MPKPPAHPELGRLCPLFSHLTDEADTTLNFASTRAEGTSSVGFTERLKALREAGVTSTGSSLAGIHHEASPNHKRAKKCNPSMCSAGAQPEIFDKQH